MSARTALYAPAHRTLARIPLGSAGAPVDAAPSVDYGGFALQDPRLPYNIASSKTGAGIIGWLATGDLKVTSQVPSTAATANIAILQHTVNGTPLSLVGSSGAGITIVPIGGFYMMPNYSNIIGVGAAAIDGLPGWLGVGNHFRSAYYDPTKGISRAVSITGIAGGAGGQFLVKGADWYGFPMSQLVTVASGANTVNTLKTFKFVQSVTPLFTDGTGTYSVGTADIFGFQIAADVFADTTIYWNNAVQVVATFLPAVVTTPATTATGDVRGTFTPPSASDGTKRLDIYIEPNAARLTTLPMANGLFGVPQV